MLTMAIPVVVDGGKIEELIGFVQARRRHRVTYSQVAAEAGIGKETLERMRRGGQCRFATVRRLARYFREQGIVVFECDLIEPCAAPVARADSA